MTECPHCHLEFSDIEKLYQKRQPMCSKCGEFLESPGFEYGACDGCGSKYEFVDGAKPSLLPDKRQRDEMDQVGKAWTKD